MKRDVGFLLGALMGLAGWAAHAQPPLTVKDYDDFYSVVILKAKNGSRNEWLASYDPVVNFINRIRQDVERLPDATKWALAKAVHDNGYWKGQEVRVRNVADPLVGSRLKAADERLKAVMTAQGFDAYRNRYEQGSGGYRFTLEVIANRAAFYKGEGKDIPGLSEIPANTTIVHAYAQSWDDMVADAKNYPNPRERMDVMATNQFNAIASALALMRASQPRTDTEMDYATAVMWRYAGHYSGKDGWEKEPLVRTPYEQLPETEKVKDRPIWRAVREALKTHPI